MNIYAGNLSQEVTEDDLRQAFEPFGQVESINLIKDKFSGESRGFGFVTMPSGKEAQAAITGLDNSDLKGRSIKVNEAQPRTENRRGGGRRGSFGSSRGGRQDSSGSSRGGRRRY